MPKKKSISKVKKKIKSVRKKVLKKIEEKELIIKTKPEWVKSALVNKAKYQKKYSDSIKKNDDFWKTEGKRITWIKPYKKIKDVKYSKKEVKIKWYEDGTLNASANCIDRHLKDKKDKTAIIWVGDDPKDTKKISYKQLHNEVSKAANGLRKLGIKKGDRVTIYLTMIPELAVTMLACARIGAVHSIIFGGFSADSISGRVNDCDSHYIITADEGVRGGKIIPLKAITDEALRKCPEVKKCIVVKRTGNKVDWVEGRDVWYDDLIRDVSNKCEPEEMNAEDPLFILYTSGSTGMPKGIVLSHRNLWDGARIVSDYLGLQSNDRLAQVLSLNFDYGLNQVFSTIHVGAQIHLTTFHFPKDLFIFIETHKITTMALMPVFLNRLFDEHFFEVSFVSSISTLRRITTSGGRISKEIVRTIGELFPKTDLYLMYGLTEAFRSTYLPPNVAQKKFNSIGMSIPDVQIMVLDKDGKECDDGVQGELVRNFKGLLEFIREDERSF